MTKDNCPISKTRLYQILSGMKQRCNNPSNQHYRWYGEKGIKVCEEWSGKDGVQMFISWSLENGYNDDLTIDRIDSSKDYCPENCRWVSRSFNSQSTSATIEDTESVSGKVRYILNACNMKQSDLLAVLNMSSKQSLSNKIAKNSWSAEDIANVATAAGCKLAFVLPDGEMLQIN